MWLAFGRLARELRDGEVVVGSGADADWRVATADLMPRHFCLTVYGLNATVRPCSRDNVVVVNGRQLTGAPHTLHQGDIIEAGTGLFGFSEDEPLLADPPPPDLAPAYLIDEHSGRAYSIVNRSTTLGRDASNTIVIADPRASRFHAEIRREAGGFALHSMGAAGTLVNGRVLEWPCLLAEGDTLRIAFANLRFSCVRPGAQTIVIADGSDSTDSRRRPTLTTAQITVSGREPDGRAAALIRLAIAVAVGTGVVAWLLLRH